MIVFGIVLAVLLRIILVDTLTDASDMVLLFVGLVTLASLIGNPSLGSISDMLKPTYKSRFGKRYVDNRSFIKKIFCIYD